MHNRDVSIAYLSLIKIIYDFDGIKRNILALQVENCACADSRKKADLISVSISRKQHILRKYGERPYQHVFYIFDDDFFININFHHNGGYWIIHHRCSNANRMSSWSEKRFSWTMPPNCWLRTGAGLFNIYFLHIKSSWSIEHHIVIKCQTAYARLRLLCFCVHHIFSVQ